jgi:hypothetical protein
VRERASELPFRGEVQPHQDSAEPLAGALLLGQCDAKILIGDQARPNETLADSPAHGFLDLSSRDRGQDPVIVLRDEFETGSVIDAIVGRETPTQRHTDLHARWFPEHDDAGFDGGHRTLSDAVADADDPSVHHGEPPILGHQDGRDDRERVFQGFRTGCIGTRSSGE